MIGLIGTGILSQLRAKLRDRAVRPVRAGCYSRAALSLTDSKTRYIVTVMTRDLRKGLKGLFLPRGDINSC